MPRIHRYRKEEPIDFSHRNKPFESTFKSTNDDAIVQADKVIKTSWERYRNLKKAYEDSCTEEDVHELVFAIAEFLLKPYEDYLKEKNYEPSA